MIPPSQQARTTNKPIKRVMISSTARDLPNDRDQIKEACLRQGMLPIMVEHLLTNDKDIIKASLNMVDEADIYLGIFAYRYGYIPKDYTISITEMEFNRAVERGIPRLIFIMHDHHPIKGSDIEKGEGMVKIEALKDRLKKEQLVSFFKSPDELLVLVINSLSNYRNSRIAEFHYVSEIPIPPQVYIAHPYVLLQTPTLIGRQAELNMLTDWVTRSSADIYQARILSIVAIGGMGKSALTWKWFNDIAPHVMQPLAGRLWWSFYESDATLENFVIRTLVYVSKQTSENIHQLSPLEREAQLLAILNHRPYLIVLDGLERLLLAYSRMDADRLTDDDLDQRTANIVAGALGLPETAAQSFTGQHQLRKTSDPRVGTFLRKLASAQAARILISTRLYPADLQTEAGSERLGCKAIFLGGLRDDDAANLWHTLGVSGSREDLLSLFHTFDNHPLLIQALAGVVANDRRTPSDFDHWRKNHPDFNPFSLPLVQVRSNVLESALRGLDETTQNVLHTIAAFRMPTSYDTLAALLVGKGKLFPKENLLVTALIDLEGRGLLGWDRRANRYDLHPIVRGVTWSRIGNRDKRDIYETLSAQFASLPSTENEQVTSLEDLTPTIELYNTLIVLGRYDDAERLYSDRLGDPILYRLGAMRQCAELLEMLFPDGLDQLPSLSSSKRQSYVLNDLAISLNDQPGRAVALYRRSIDLFEREGDQKNTSISLGNLSEMLRLSGALCESETAARRALLITQQLSDQDDEVYSLYYLGATLAVRGMVLDSAKALDRSLKLARRGSVYRAYDYQAMRALWLGQYANARILANNAMVHCQQIAFERGMLRAAWLQGAAALGLNDLSTAEEHLQYALTRARTVNLMEEELPALVGLVELQRRQGNLKAARELLDDVWEPVERGPYCLYHADAFNVLAQIERDADNHEEAVKAAAAAYRLAWCDGPPFSYHWGLQNAKVHLATLEVPEPILAPFDPSKYEPIPDVEIESSENTTLI